MRTTSDYLEANAEEFTRLFNTILASTTSGGGSRSTLPTSMTRRSARRAGRSSPTAACAVAEELLERDFQPTGQRYTSRLCGLQGAFLDVTGFHDLEESPAPTGSCRST